MTGLTVTLAGAILIADPCGALVWPERQLLVVADLHLEKGSAYAARGQLLPPYDTTASLETLAAAIRRHRPRRVICLGDSFHDRRAADRLPVAERTRLAALMRGLEDWCWIAGNHDPAPPVAWGGRAAAAETVDGFTFRHEPAGPIGTNGVEVFGHLHPVAAVRAGGRRIRGRCFATDGRRLAMPAFGAYTGGLNVLDPVFRSVLGPGFAVYLLARSRVHRVVRSALEPD